MDGSEVVTGAKPVLRAPIMRQPGQIGVVVAISGFKLSCLIFGDATGGRDKTPYAAAQIGALIKVPTPSSTAYGFISSLSFEQPSAQSPTAIAEVDLLGEQLGRGANAQKSFSRGISVFPVLGGAVFATGSEDIALIYAKPNTWTLSIGTLHQDASVPAYLMSQEFLSKHSAIVGTTGSGKSCAVTLMLRTLLTAHPNGHVVMLDPHGEYAHAFTDLGERVTPDTLQLPYWLFSFEEIVEVLCSKDPISRSREIPILKDTILAAKQDFLGTNGKTASLTVDTPTPYRMNTLVQRINDGMGKLDRPDSSLPYLRLLTTIENLRRDRRYNFMFEGLTVRDNMAEILSRILRIPVAGKPITILDISAVPSEIVNVVVSLLCRLIFDFALWSEREEAIPILLVCDEAHRYIPRDENAGFEPTRRSIARIAKEGRKYGVSLCLVTQRPSELSESILSQCSTVFALRMNNERDQTYVRGMLPDNAAGLMGVLPSLRQREAIAVGEGVAHPMRIRFAELDPNFRPKGEAANFPKAWEDDRKGREFLGQIIERWRQL
jgi:DNA helicase HerA-like ATPase